MLLHDFASQTLAMDQIYQRHHIGRRYVEANYKAALLNLERLGKIVANPPAEKRPKRNGERTFGGRVALNGRT